jgi:UTP:GlnB (protein PII) uridylyltransferase
MSSITEEIADKLALATIEAAEILGDENLVQEVAKVIGASSTTTQEAFMTAYRVRVSQKRAEKFLAAALAKGPKDPSKGRIELGSRQILNAPEEGAGGGH